MIDRSETQRANTGSARKSARKILKGAGIDQPPVLLKDIVSFLQRTHQLSIVPWDLGDVDGIQATKGESIFIGYDAKKHPHRKRFTVAHEIGHYVLGHTSLDYTPINFSDKSPEEIEANKFAAELLVPFEMLKSDICNGLKDVKLLAEKYYISEMAMWNRIRERDIFKLL